jgi:hypothetical protein
VQLCSSHGQQDKKMRQIKRESLTVEATDLSEVRHNNFVSTQICPSPRDRSLVKRITTPSVTCHLSLVTCMGLHHLLTPSFINPFHFPSGSLSCIDLVIPRHLTVATMDP